MSPATLHSAQEFEAGHFIGVYTFSKSYAMTGWRIGYVVNEYPTYQNYLSITCSTRPAPILASFHSIPQRATEAALTGPQDCVAEMREAYRRRRDIAVALLKDLGRYVYTPHEAFYILIDVSNCTSEPRQKFYMY